MRNIRSGGGVAGEIRSSASIWCGELCLGFRPAQKRSIKTSCPRVVATALCRRINACLRRQSADRYNRDCYREMSVWLSNLNPSPSRTEDAQSVSSTCRARAANPRG